LAQAAARVNEVDPLRGRGCGSVRGVTDATVSRGRKAAPSRPGDTAEEAYVRLRELIVEGDFAPGQRLPHAKLQEALGVGRTPLRTALSRLQSDGLVTATPNHGVTVAAAPVSSAEEIYTLRYLVEPPLLEASAAGIPPRQIARLRELLRRMKATAGDPAAFAVAHREFHTVERAAFTSPFIDELVLDMYRHLHRHQRTRLARSYAPVDFLRLDRETVDALEAGDGLRARRTLEFHLVDAAVSFLGDADENHRPALLLAVARANGMTIEADADGLVPRPARVEWTTPCPTLPALSTPYLVYQPSDR
jgi:DNA-binding GntR family transcriptional regulator